MNIKEQIFKPWEGYVFSLVIFGISLLISFTLHSFGQLHRVYLFLAAICITALLYGLKPALLVTVISTLAMNYFVLPPFQEFAFNSETVPSLVAFSATAIFIIYLTENRKQSERRFRATFEQAAVGMAHTDLDGRWLRVNQKLCDIVGYSREEIINKPFVALTHPDDARENVNYIQRMINGEIAIYDTDKRYIRKDGKSTWTHLTVALVHDDSGKPDYFISVMQDINARKQAEAEVRDLNAELEQRVSERTEALEAVNKQLENFTYTVSHDLRAPLRAIEGFSRILLENYSGQLDEMGQEFAQRIVGAAQRMEQLIEDLLQYSRLERAAFKPGLIDLNQVLIDAQTTLSEEISAREALIKVESPLAMVSGHHGTLTQVVTNLLANALKFVDEGSPPQITIWTEERGEWIRLNIRDNGIGIASEHQKRIFNIFERLHGSETYPGTGIGLAIVAKAMERMGGKVGVQSALDQGSIFWVELKKVE
jgi:PAS domain S-box-containing protein